MSRVEYCFDIEGNGIGRKCTRVHCMWIKDRQTKEKWGFRPHEIGAGIKKLQEADVLWAHNGAAYDKPVLERLYRCQLPPVRDTLVISKILYPDIKNHPIGDNKLESWGKHLGTLKGEYEGGWDEFNEEMFFYCEQDVEVQDALVSHLAPRIEEYRFPELLETKVATFIGEQIDNGISFDREACDLLEQELISAMARIEDELQIAFPPLPIQLKTKVKYQVFNPGSRKQIAERLIAKYGWKPTKRTEPTKNFPEGQVQIDEKVLEDMPYPEAALLNRWNLMKKRIEHVDAWIANYEDHGTGRIHGFVNPLGCVSSRMSHSGPNLAQVTKVVMDKATKKPLTGEAGGWGWDSRKLFRASEGKVMVGADLSGLELRCLANRMWAWDNGAYAKVLLEGDIHTTNMEAAGLTSRDNAKTFIYALLYGAGDEKIGKIVSGTKNDGARLRSQFLSNLPALASLLSFVHMRTERFKSLVGIDGRLIPVRSKHMALNTQLQSDGAIIAKVAFVLAYPTLTRQMGVKFLLNIHDEFQVECDPEKADAVGQALVESMQKAGTVLGCKIPITGEYKIGNNWAETH